MPPAHMCRAAGVPSPRVEPSDYTQLSMQQAPQMRGLVCAPHALREPTKVLAMPQPWRSNAEGQTGSSLARVFEKEHS